MMSGHPIGDPAELAALYAAGALDASEQGAFEAHLEEGCPQCAAQMRKLAPVMTMLTDAVAPVTPHDATRSALLQRVADAAPRTSSGTAPSPQIWRQWAGDQPLEDLFILRAAQARWDDTGVAGVRIRRLFVDRARDQVTMLVRMDPNTAYPRHIHHGAEECFVLEGDLHVGEDVLRPGDYQRAAPGSRHGIQRTDQGCLLLIVSSLSDELEA